MQDAHENAMRAALSAIGESVTPSSVSCTLDEVRLEIVVSPTAVTIVDRRPSMAR
jgi:hypothetical protein